MSERAGHRTALFRGLYLVLMLLCIYLPLLPFSMDTGRTVLPDVTFLLTAAWVLRRPDAAPLALVAVLALLSDFLSSSAVGLHALLLVLAVEFLRTQVDRLRDEMFLLEWLTVVAVLGVITLFEQMVMGLTLSPLPDADLLLIEVFVTVAAYPCVVAFLHWVVRLRVASNDRLSRFGRLS